MTTCCTAGTVATAFPLRVELARSIVRGWTTVETDAPRRLDEALDTIEPATLRLTHPQPGDAPARRVPGGEERETMSFPKDAHPTKGRQNVLHYPPDIYRGNRGEISAWMRPN